MSSLDNVFLLGEDGELGEENDRAETAHHRDIIIRGEGDVLDKAAHLCLSLAANERLLDGALTAVEGDSEDVVFSGGEADGVRVGSHLAASGVSEAEALAFSGASDAVGDIEVEKGIAAEASVAHSQFGFVDVVRHGGS
jgi:hypothetical protein